MRSMTTSAYIAIHTPTSAPSLYTSNPISLFTTAERVAAHGIPLIENMDPSVAEALDLIQQLFALWTESADTVLSAELSAELTISVISLDTNLPIKFQETVQFLKRVTPKRRRPSDDSDRDSTPTTQSHTGSDYLRSGQHDFGHHGQDYGRKVRALAPALVRDTTGDVGDGLPITPPTLTRILGWDHEISQTPRTSMGWEEDERLSNHPQNGSMAIDEPTRTISTFQLDEKQRPMVPEYPPRLFEKRRGKAMDSGGVSVQNA